MAYAIEPYQSAVWRAVMCDFGVPQLVITSEQLHQRVHYHGQIVYPNADAPQSRAWPNRPPRAYAVRDLQQAPHVFAENQMRVLARLQAGARDVMHVKVEVQRALMPPAIATIAALRVLLYARRLYLPLKVAAGEHELGRAAVAIGWLDRTVLPARVSTAWTSQAQRRDQLKAIIVPLICFMAYVYRVTGSFHTSGVDEQLSSLAQRLVGVDWGTLIEWKLLAECVFQAAHPKRLDAFWQEQQSADVLALQMRVRSDAPAHGTAVWRLVVEAVEGEFAGPDALPAHFAPVAQVVPAARAAFARSVWTGAAARHMFGAEDLPAEVVRLTELAGALVEWLRARDAVKEHERNAAAQERYRLLVEGTVANERILAPQLRAALQAAVVCRELP